MVIEALRDIPRHFDMLFLIAPHRHLGGTEHQDIGGHQHRVTVKRHRDPLVLVGVAVFQVRLHGSLVRMCPIHQPFGCDTREKPHKLRDLRDV